MLISFLLAVSFLTRLPVPSLGNITHAHMARSALFYPLVGLIIGGLLCIPAWLLAHTSPLVVAAIITVLGAALTGGLHLDGLADSADAWLGGFGDEAKTHQILKDPLLGAAGVIALISVLLLKFVSLTVLVVQHDWLGIILAPALGRSLILLLFLTTPYVRAQGLASAVTAGLSPQASSWIIVFTLTVALFYSLIASSLILLGFWLTRRLMLQRIRGCTGDTAGAVVEISEMLWLVGLSLNFN